MVVAAYRLSHSGEGGNHPYDNFGVVDYGRTDTGCVDVRHDNNREGYFENSFFLLVVTNRDAASDVHVLDCLLCAPAVVDDLVPAATSQFPSDSPSVAACDDTQDCTLCPDIEHHNCSLFVLHDYKQDAKTFCYPSRVLVLGLERPYHAMVRVCEFALSR